MSMNDHDLVDEAALAARGPARRRQGRTAAGSRDGAPARCTARRAESLVAALAVLATMALGHVACRQELPLDTVHGSLFGEAYLEEDFVRALDRIPSPLRPDTPQTRRERLTIDLWAWLRHQGEAHFLHQAVTRFRNRQDADALIAESLRDALSRGWLLEWDGDMERRSRVILEEAERLDSLEELDDSVIEAAWGRIENTKTAPYFISSMNQWARLARIARSTTDEPWKVIPRTSSDLEAMNEKHVVEALALYESARDAVVSARLHENEDVMKEVAQIVDSAFTHGVILDEDELATARWLVLLSAVSREQQVDFLARHMVVPDPDLRAAIERQLPSTGPVPLPVGPDVATSMATIPFPDSIAKRDGLEMTDRLRDAFHQAGLRTSP